MTTEADFERRFGGVRRLYGERGLAQLQAAHVCVIGLGGVGSWAAEALARSAVGQLTLIDLDNIAESNVNRQLHAIDGEFGKAKVSAMAARIHAINPQCRLTEIEDFISADNIAILLAGGFNVVVDAIDDARAKIALAAYCRQRRLPLVMAGAAGGRLDPSRVRSGDLAQATGDRLLAKIRTGLRRDHGFPKAATGKKTAARFGISCIYSDEPVIRPDAACEADGQGLAGLNCAGYGSSVCVTAAFGMAAAAIALNQLAG